MKKTYLRVLLGIAVVFGIAGALMWRMPHPMLLENDAQILLESDDTVFLPDGQVPLTGLPGEELTGDLHESPDTIQAEYAREVLSLVNEAREKAGIPALEADAALEQAAQIRAAECAGKFSHTRPDGTSYKTAIAEAGIETGYAGENAATGYTSAQHVMQGWMKSSGHKANILNKNYTKIGIGLVENTKSHYGGYVWIQLFIK